MKSPVKHITCKKCGEEKTPDEYYDHKQTRSGKDYSRCKVCFVKSARERQDPSKKSVYDKQRRAKKLQEIRDYDKHRSKLPHRKSAKAESTARRRRALKQQTPGWANLRDIQSMYKLCQKLNALTSSNLQVDHIIPLNGTNVCGLHVETNLQLLDSKLNNRKSNHWEIPR